MFMKKIRPKQYSQISQKDILTEVLIKQNKVDFALAIIIMFSSSVVFLLSIYHQSFALKILWGILFLFGMAFFIHGVNNYKIEKNINYQLINYYPERIVWVYCHISQIMPFGIYLYKRCRMYICDINGNSTTIMVDSKNANQLMDYLQSRLKGATFGHSIQKEQLYRANPLLLKK